MQIFVFLGDGLFQYFRFNQNSSVVNLAAILNQKWIVFSTKMLHISTKLLSLNIKSITSKTRRVQEKTCFDQNHGLHTKWPKNPPS